MNCLKYVIEGKIERMEVMRIRGRRRNLLLDDLKERKGYCKLKEEALYHSLGRIRCRKTEKRMNV
jgi:hypothetical protein